MRAAIEILCNWAAIYVHPEQFTRHVDSPQVGINRALENSADIIRQLRPAPPQLTEEELKEARDIAQRAVGYGEDEKYDISTLLAIIDRLTGKEK